MTAPVLLDACVLVPQRLSSLLLTLAEEGLFEPRWSERLLAETERALTGKLGLSRDRAVRRLAAMREAFPEAAVHGFEPLEEELTCHAKDRHVLAAAIAAGADTLVTFNVRDFPDQSSQPHGITVTDPDVFLLELMARDGRGCQAAVEREAQRMRRPAMTTQDVLAGVASVVPTFANTLHQAMLDGVAVTSEMPAYLAVPHEQTPLQEYAGAFDLTDPLHAALTWWTALGARSRDLAVLHALTWSPAAFGDYVWAEELLAGRSIASRVYYAVDDSASDVAFIRFVPEVSQSAQVFESFFTRGARFLTLKRRQTGRNVVCLGPRGQNDRRPTGPRRLNSRAASRWARGHSSLPCCEPEGRLGRPHRYWSRRSNAGSALGRPGAISDSPDYVPEGIAAWDAHKGISHRAGREVSQKAASGTPTEMRSAILGPYSREHVQVLAASFGDVRPGALDRRPVRLRGRRGPGAGRRRRVAAVLLRPSAPDVIGVACPDLQRAARARTTGRPPTVALEVQPARCP